MAQLTRNRSCWKCLLGDLKSSRMLAKCSEDELRRKKTCGLSPIPSLKSLAFTGIIY
jgi:hypothetical protein